MTTAQLSPPPIFRAFDNNGNPLAGGLLYTYAAGTTTPQASYPSASELTPNTNPIVLNFRGECALWLDPTLVYKLQLTDTLGNTIPGYPVDNVTTASIPTQAQIGLALYPQTAFESAAGVTPTLYYYPPGDLRRYGGVADSGTTNNTGPLSNALKACAGFVPVVVQAAGTFNYGGITGVVTVPSGTDLQLKDGATLQWASTTVSTGPNIAGVPQRPGLWLTGSTIKITGQGKILGPTAVNTFVQNEIGIVLVGTSAAAPYTNITIDGIEVNGWGQYGILLKWVQDARITNCYIHDCGYSGITVMSVTNVIVTGNEVGPIQPGAGANAYGMNFTYDTATSNSRTDPNHMCIGIECAYNFVHDIPLWLGITTHGSFDSRFHHNKVYNCWTAIQAGADGSGSFCGNNNDVSFNVCEINQYNGSATTVTVANPVGITVNGNTTLHAGVTVIGNVLTGYGGGASGTSFGVQASSMDYPVIVGNIFLSWSGYGIYMSGAASLGGVVANNVFEAVNLTFASDACIYLDGNTTSPLVFGNVHNISSGTKAHYGLAIVATANGTAVAGPNDFSAAQTAPYYDIGAGAVPPASSFTTAYFPSALEAKGGIGVFGTSPPAQSTGWGTPVGGAVISSYNITDAGGANSNTNKVVAQLIAVLKATGIIAA